MLNNKTNNIMCNIVSYIDSVNDKIVGKGASETEIEYAQIALKVKFNEEYLEVLKNYGCLLIKGETLFGVVKNKSYDVVYNTMIEKERYQSIPEEMYVISSLGIEGVLILQNEDGAIFEFTDGHPLKLIYDSLLDYLKSL